MVATIILIGAMGFASLLGAGGQIALNLASESFAPSVKGIILNGWLWAFALLYGVGVIINIYAYKLGGKVSILYPVISLSYIFAAILAWKFLGEPFNWFTVAGCCVIIAGVGLIGYGANA